MSKLFIERVSESAIVPTRGTTYAAAYDLYADIEKRKLRFYDELNAPYDVLPVGTVGGVVHLPPKHRVILPTGWKMRCAIDEAIEFHPRSGTAIKEGVTLVNAMGLIDADYSDEAGLLLINHSDVVMTIKHGERFGQMMVRKVEPIDLNIVEELPVVESNRTGGMGSTGKN